MKQNKAVRRAGPFKVASISQDGRGVRMMVYPAFPAYNLSEKDRQRRYLEIDPCWLDEPRWAVQRLRNGHGGGPSIFIAIALAAELEKFLNQWYSEEEANEWKATLEEALAKVTEKDEKRFERAMAKAAKP